MLLKIITTKIGNNNSRTRMVNDGEDSHVLQITNLLENVSLFISRCTEFYVAPFPSPLSIIIYINYNIFIYNINIFQNSYDWNICTSCVLAMHHRRWVSHTGSSHWVAWLAAVSFYHFWRKQSTGNALWTSNHTVRHSRLPLFPEPSSRSCTPYLRKKCSVGNNRGFDTGIWTNFRLEKMSFLTFEWMN